MMVRLGSLDHRLDFGDRNHGKDPDEQQDQREEQSEAAERIPTSYIVGM